MHDLLSKWERSAQALKRAWAHSIKPMFLLIWVTLLLSVKWTFKISKFVVNWASTFVYTFFLVLSVYLTYKITSFLSSIMDWLGVIKDPIHASVVSSPVLQAAMQGATGSADFQPQMDWMTWVSLAPHNSLLYVLISFQFLTIVFLIFKPGKVTRMCEHGFRVEAVRAGSELKQTTCPDFVGELWVKTNRFTPAFRRATIFRVAAHLHTAQHALEGALSAWIKYNGKYMALDLKTVVQRDQDWVTLPYEQVSALQMASGKFSKNVSSMFVSVHNGDYSSMGKITPHTVVGTLEYDGSTTPSFSGAPYYMGRVVMGMHFGASVMNIGYNGAFMRTIMELPAIRNTIYKPESADAFSTDFGDQLLEEFTKTGGKPTFRRMANDFYVVDIGGKFVTYSEEEFESAQETYEMKSSKHPKKYGKEAVSGAELAAMGVVFDAAPKPVVKVPKVLESLPDMEEPVSAGLPFTYQDSENQGNLKMPAADVTPAAGASCKVEPVPATQPMTKDILHEIPSPIPNLKNNTPMVGLKRQVARQNVLSAITYDTLRAWLSLTEQLERDGIHPVKAEMDVLREMWFGRSAQRNEIQ